MFGVGIYQFRTQTPNVPDRTDIYCGLESYVFSSCDANRLTVDLPTCSNSIYLERTKKKRRDEILESTSIPLRGVGSGVTWTRDPKVFLVFFMEGEAVPNQI